MSDLAETYGDNGNTRTRAPGEIDWMTLWRSMIDAERAQVAAIAPPTSARSQDRWAGQGARYAAAAQRAPQPDAFLKLVLPHIKPTDTILDIGAGSGRHTVFLAPRVARVIAVEPSAEMRHHLLQNITSHHLTNVEVVAEPWPAINGVSSDLTICAHVVYGVRDIGPFLQRMHEATRRGCFLAVGIRPPSEVLHRFWEWMYGEQKQCLPGALECLNVLYQLGIAANLTTFPTTPYTFADEAEALVDIRWRLRLLEDPITDARIRSAIAQLLRYDDVGQLTVSEAPAHTTMLWWRP